MGVEHALYVGAERLVVGDVGLLAVEPAAFGCADALTEAFQLGRHRVRDAHDRALGEEAEGHRLAEGTGTAGDDRHPPGHDARCSMRAASSKSSAVMPCASCVTRSTVTRL